MILGVDEVGRGAWAGPLVVGAACLNGAEIQGLTDSKVLTKKRREELYEDIMASDAAIGLGWVSAAEVDEVGLSDALRLATRRAVEQINVPYHEIIIDGTINFLAGTTKGQYVTTLAKADLLVPSVSAASIVAKVARDRWMTEQDELFDGYSFSAHVGYGTAKHLEALQNRGVCELHRRSFAPVQKIINKPLKIEQNLRVSTKTTKQIGDAAENIAMHELESRGHTILERNWKTKFCEIDIVSRLDQTIYFTEVKYRKNAKHGDGFAAITPKKLKQMEFAAKTYMQYAQLSNIDMRLVAAAVTDSSSPRVELFTEVE